MTDDMNELTQKFFAFLTKRPCTRKQAYEYLSRQKINENDIDALMNEAESSGLIDDLTFAKLFAEGHLTWGNLKIAYELSMRGISRENINAALDEVEDEVTRAYEIVNSLREKQVDNRKITSRLISRGFTSRAIRSALKGE
jgi:SOS response regulatory protein OraA/RecX